MTPADVAEVLRSVAESGEPQPAVFWAIAIAVALAVGATMAIQGLVSQVAKPDIPQTDNAPTFQGPRASYGDAVPFVFGTLQIRSPVCIYGGDVTEGFIDFELQDPSGLDRLHYSSTVDLVLCERVLTDGAEVGTIQLRKIWIGQNLLWDGSNFATPVTTTGDLLEHDPNVADSLIPGGGVEDPIWGDQVGDFGWWWGGIIGEGRAITKKVMLPLEPHEPVEFETITEWHGDILGGYQKIANSGVWARYLGMEKVRFYAGSGAETQNAMIGSLLYKVDWNTTTDHIYPSYHKLARLVFEEFIWGVEPQIEDISVEVTVSCPVPAIGDTSGLMPNGLDVNPVSVLYTLLTHPDFCGSPKVPGVDDASFTEAAAIVRTEGLGMSYRLQAPTRAEQLIETVLQHIDGTLYRDPESGLIRLKLLRLVQTEIPTFNASHVLELADVSKSTWEATYSQARVTFEMRSVAANEQGARNVAVAKDPGLAANNGLTETLEADVPTVYDADAANLIAVRRLSAANTPLTKVQLRMNRRGSNGGAGIASHELRPGDVFRLDYAPLVVSNLRLRVVKISFGTLDDNAVTVTAIQDIYQAQAIIAPPDQPDGYTIVDPPEEVEIETYRMFTAPYYIARTGLGPDARRNLTTAPLYRVDEDTEGKQFAVNYDRFMMLAKAPYAGATSFQWSVLDSDGASVHSAIVPYTECGTLAVGVPGIGVNDPGNEDSLSIQGLTPDGIALLASAPDKLVLIDNEIFLVSAANVTIGDTVDSVVIDPVERLLLDSSPTSGSSFAHSLGATVWILETHRSDWMLERLSPPIQSCVEEYWDFDAEAPTDGRFDDFQTLGAAHTMRIRNIEPSKRNAEASTTVVLQDRANRALPPRQVDVPTTTVDLSSATTSFSFDFEPFTSGDWSRLYQQREIGHLSGEPGDSFSLLLPRLQDTGDLNSAESIAGLIPESAEDDRHHVAKLEVWYEYLTGPLSGTIRQAFDSSSPTTPAGDGAMTFLAEAEGTTRTITCYLRACFAPYILGDAGYIPIRRSVVRTFSILLTRS